MLSKKKMREIAELAPEPNANFDPFLEYNIYTSFLHESIVEFQITTYLGKRDFIDHIKNVELIGKFSFFIVLID